LKDGDFTQIGQIATQNAMTMHATMLAATPPILYLKDKSMEALALITELNNEGIECFYTLDAGSNVKVITTKTHVETLVKRLKSHQFTKLYQGKPSFKGAFISDEG